MNSATCSRSTIFSLVHSAHQPALARPSSLSICPSRLYLQMPRRARSSVGKSSTQAIRPKTPAERSVKGRMKEAEAAAMKDINALQSDVGMFPGTFVRPVMSNMPSLFQEPKKRWAMEWGWLKSYAIGFGSALYYCLSRKPVIPVRIIERKYAAIDLHRKMYTAFANGDTATLQKICCDGLYQSFSKRISHRPRDSPKLVWHLHDTKFNRFVGSILKYIYPKPVRNVSNSMLPYLYAPYSKLPEVIKLVIKGPFPYLYAVLSPSYSHARVVSDRASIVEERKLGIRQVVVRIRSRQSLIKPTPKQSQGDQQKQLEEKEKDCTEYLVIQRLMMGNEEGDWKVWGLADETTLKDFETDPSFHSEGSSVTDMWANRYSR